MASQVSGLGFRRRTDPSEPCGGFGFRYSSCGFSDCGPDSLSDYTAPLLCAKRNFLINHPEDKSKAHRRAYPTDEIFPNAPRGRSEAAMVKIRNLASDKVIRVELNDATVGLSRRRMQFDNSVRQEINVKVNRSRWLGRSGTGRVRVECRVRRHAAAML